MIGAQRTVTKSQPYTNLPAECLWQHHGQARPAFATEPDEGQESVWDYPLPPVSVEDTRFVEVRMDGLIVARTKRSLRRRRACPPPAR